MINYKILNKKKETEMTDEFSYIKRSAKYVIGASVLLANLSSAAFGVDFGESAVAFGVGFGENAAVKVLEIDKDGYYKIGSSADFRKFADLANGDEPGAKGKLMNDIVIDDQVKINNKGELEADGVEKWTPIGTKDKPFNGEFISNKDISISGLYINSDNDDNVGLFGVVGENGKINDVRLINSYIKGRNQVGGIAGKNKGTIDGCSVTRVKVEGNKNVGGNVGKNDRTLNNINSYDVDITGSSSVGGNVGKNKGIIEGSKIHSRGKISGNNYIGGNVGWNWKKTISGKLTNEGEISGKKEGGGNVGYNEGQITAELTNTGKVTGTSYDVGGNVGENSGTISGKLINEGEISGKDAVGGNVGFNSQGQITAEAKLTNKGKIIGTEKCTGGNVGENFFKSTISGELTNEGEISGQKYVGGNVGLNHSQIAAELTNKIKEK